MPWHLLSLWIRFLKSEDFVAELTQKKFSFVEIWKIFTAVTFTPIAFWEGETVEEEDVLALYKRFGFFAFGLPIFIAGIHLLVSGKFELHHIRALVSSYLISLCVSYVMAWIMHDLSPRFGGRRDLTGALKLNLFSQSAPALASFLLLLPFGRFVGYLQVAAAAYSLYVLYLGIPKMLSIPKEKHTLYFALVLLIMMAIGIVMGTIISP